MDGLLLEINIFEALTELCLVGIAMTTFFLEAKFFNITVDPQFDNHAQS